MAYEEVIIRKGGLISKGIKKVPDAETIPTRDKKIVARKEIEENVFDLEDSVADNAKMLSLLITVISRIYSALSDDTKDNLSDTDRDVIEYTFDKFANTETRADVQFAKEGPLMIDKLMSRQAEIGAIVK